MKFINLVRIKDVLGIKRICLFGEFLEDEAFLG